MATSEIGIYNLALTKLGDARVASPTQAGKAAETMNSLYAPMRDAELRRNRWKFALKRASLVAHVDVPMGYARQFALPADFLHLVQVGDIIVRPAHGTYPWVFESGRLLSNLAAPLFIRYVRRVDNAGEFDPLFVETLACKMAFEACEALTQSKSKKEGAWQDYKAALMDAVRVDAIEQLPDDLPWGSWLDSREGGGLGTLHAADDITGYSGFTVL